MEDDLLTPHAGTSRIVIHSPFAKRLQQMATVKEMEPFTVRREAIVAKLRRIKNMMSEGVAARSITVHHLDTYLRRVDCCYDEYNAIQNEAYTAFPEERSDQEKYFIAFETLYEDLRVEICVALEALRRNAATTATGQAQLGARQQNPTVIHQQPGLPHVPLPVFEGDYDKWCRFKQLFNDLMQKYPNISDATKLHYLTQSLKGKAENIISEQILNQNNFQAAWNVLAERFENKRTIVDVHINGLLNLNKMTMESSVELRQLVEECNRHVEALDFHDQKLLGLSESLIVTLLTSKLDKTTLGHWETTQEPKQLPKYKETLRFLQNRCFILERCEASKPIDTVKLKPAVARAPVKVHASVQLSDDVCTVCDSSHNVNKCNVFKQMDITDRWNKVREKQLCYNCLKRGHRVGQCSSRVCTVSGCGKKHHTQLHNEGPPAVKVPQSEDQADSEIEEQASSSKSTTSSIVACARTTLTEQKKEKHVMLSTAVVEVKDFNGVYHPCRVLLDSGSQSNFVSERTMKLLQLKGVSVHVPVVGINGEGLTVHCQTEAEIKSTTQEGNWKLQFLVVPQVTGVLPSRRIDTRQWKLPASLADPKFDVPARVDMLIGAEIFFELLLPQNIAAINGQPALWGTKLGWIVCGSYAGVHRPVTVKQVSHIPLSQSNLEHLVQRFRQQVELFEEDNLKENNQSNVEQLERRVLQLEKRLTGLKSLYTAFINEYESLGHSKLVEKESSSATTKIRIVFDNSARSNTADVIKMYRQIRVDPLDCWYQTILWRDASDEELLTYELETAVYDTSCAPFCATACLKQLSIDKESRYPGSTKVVRSDCYMDNVFSGGDDLEERLKDERQLIALLRSDVSELQKWCRNAPQLLEDIPEERRVYLHTVTSDGSAEMHLLCCKSPVAPLLKTSRIERCARPFTIPIAELCGALLLARLIHMVIERLDMQAVNLNESRLRWNGPDMLPPANYKYQQIELPTFAITELPQVEAKNAKILAQTQKEGFAEELQLRGLWYTSKLNIQVTTLRPRGWSLGRVLQVHPGDYKVALVVTGETADGKFRRGISKITFLPVQPPGDDSSVDTGANGGRMS